ncbi:MAG: class II glutamine amidotransferase, partial [Myxococcota bacterium]|nr:class II glutamine amidotransferase [Myxococcota bacterium]
MIGRDAAAPVVAVGLQAIQHRGQDSAGIGTLDGGRLRLAKGMGLVQQAVPLETLAALEGRASIGHVRYPTAGRDATREDAQPFITRRPGILLAHNGNVTNVPELQDQLQSQGLVVLSQCDAEPILLVLAQELTDIRPADHTTEDLVQAVSRLFARVKGAYSVVALMELDGQTSLVAFRDPHGIRPGVYGRDETGAWMTASESVALDVLGFDKQGDLPVGGVLILREGQDAVVRPVLTPSPRHCVFERIYFARTDSRMEDGRINRTRWLLGRRLAKEWSDKGLDADLVMAVPDTSRPAAMAMAEELGLPNREGFIKNRYSGRTFIMPD